MSTAAEERPNKVVADVERLLEEVEQFRDTAARDKALEAVQALLELYGMGLARIMDAIEVRQDPELARLLAEDELVAHLLLLHGLHPVPLQTRVLDGLGEVRPYLESHGGNVELLEVDGVTVRLRLRGSCSGCPSSTMTLKLAIENAIRKAAPEIEEVLAEDEGSAPPGSSPLLQIELAPGLEATADEQPIDATWTMAGGLPELSSGGLIVKPIAGQQILFARLGEQPYAYRSTCPACGQSLASAVLVGAQLSCAGCANRYDVMRAGRCLDSPRIHLEPVPLLVGADGLVKIALAMPA